MVTIIAAVSMVCLTMIAAALALRVRRSRDLDLSCLHNASVSRQWLVQHQADDTQ